MRSQGWPPPTVVGISLKARSAINLSGHRPDAVIWLDERDGEWVTSTAFAKAPAPFFADFIARHPMTREMGRTWDRSMPKERYLYDYSTRGSPAARRTPRRSFRTSRKGRGDEVGGAITDAWEASPYSDAYLNGLAMAAIDAMKLGRGPATDFLGISFSALDKIGHDLRSRLARSAGHAVPSRRADRAAARQARSRRRHGQLRRRLERRITAWRRCPSALKAAGLRRRPHRRPARSAKAIDGVLAASSARAPTARA